MERTPGPVRIAYDRVGEGPVVVFLHGIGGNRTNWRRQLQAFGNRFSAVAWDARGYGDSDDPPAPLRFRDYADDLHRLLDHLGADRAHLVGMSMGGMILQDFVGRHPERVATLGLIDTSAGFGRAPENVTREFLARRLAPLEAGLRPVDLAPGLVDALVSPRASPQIREELVASLAALRVGPYKQALHAIVTTDFRSVLPRIAAPTLIVVGAEDGVTPPHESDFLCAQIPGAEKIVLPGIGHLTNLEAPDAFNAAVGAFLDRHRARAVGPT